MYASPTQNVAEITVLYLILQPSPGGLSKIKFACLCGYTRA